MLGVFFMTEAVRLGDMSVVIPFRYTRMLFSMAAGIFILGEQINLIMIIGSALTIFLVFTSGTEKLLCNHYDRQGNFWTRLLFC